MYILTSDAKSIIDSRFVERFCIVEKTDHERRCCADCWHKKHHKCKNPCLNDPSRCGLQNVSKPNTQRVKEENTHGTI